jgi:hypothetical protein
MADVDEVKAVLSNKEAIMKSLKIRYDNKMGTLLGRDGSLIKKIAFEKAGGKAYNISAVAGAGGAVAGNYDTARAKMANSGQQAEFSVTPGAVWATHKIDKATLAAGKSNLDVYAPILTREFYRSTAVLRKTLSNCLYTRGFGEFAVVKESLTATVGTNITINLDPTETQKVEIGRDIVIKAHIGDSEVDSLIEGTVEARLGGMKGIVIKPTKAGTAAAGSIICYAGSVAPDTSTPILPMGLDGWFPMVNCREGTAWENYIDTVFFGQKRKSDPDRYAGAFYKPLTDTEKKVDTLQNALMLNRAMGGDADLIVVNLLDRADIDKEIQAQGWYYSDTKSKSARKVNIGTEEFSVSASTNFVDLVIDDVDCPRGKFYVLTSSSLAMLIWLSKNDQNRDDGIDATAPGKADVESAGDGNFGDGVSKLNIEDYITIDDNAHTWRGPACAVTLGFIGALAVYDPSANVVGVFAQSDGDYSKILGYTA